MSKEMTHWFPENIHPFRNGVYEVTAEGFYSYWNGVFWSRATKNFEMAKNCKLVQSYSQQKTWRGFTKEQK